MAFPVSLPDDGLIDIVAMPVVRSFRQHYAIHAHVKKVSRSHMLRALSVAANGESFWDPKVTSKSVHSNIFLIIPAQVHYIKARAYRIEPLKNRGNLSVDGEAMPFEKFQVEVHTRLATLLSLHGSYVADFPPSGKKQRKWPGGSQR